MPVPEAARIRRTVSETVAPPSTERDTGASQSRRPEENTASVRVPSGTARRQASERVPAARTEGPLQTEISFAEARM